MRDYNFRKCVSKDFEEVDQVKIFDNEPVNGSLICLNNYDGIMFNESNSTPKKPSGLSIIFDKCNGNAEGVTCLTDVERQ